VDIAATGSRVGDVDRSGVVGITSPGVILQAYGALLGLGGSPDLITSLEGVIRRTTSLTGAIERIRKLRGIK
jgi:hypothetical protein